MSETLDKPAIIKALEKPPFPEKGAISFVPNKAENPLIIGRLAIKNAVFLDGQRIYFIGPSDRDYFNFLAQAMGAPMPFDYFMRAGFTKNEETLGTNISRLRRAFKGNGQIIPSRNTDRSIPAGTYKIDMNFLQPVPKM